MRGISCLSLRLQGVWISYLILDSDSGSSEAETDNAIKTQNAQETYNKYDIKNNKDIQDTNETFNNTNKPQNNTIYTKKDQQQLKENQTDISKTMITVFFSLWTKIGVKIIEKHAMCRISLWTLALLHACVKLK